jgi:hypothetical protein
VPPAAALLPVTNAQDQRNHTENHEHGAQ